MVILLRMKLNTKLKYMKFSLFATMLLSSAISAQAEGVAQQMQQQQYQYQQQQPQQYQQPYVTEDNDSNYRLPGQYSPTLNDLRKQFPVQQVQQPSPYQQQQYDQNDNSSGQHNYYYQ